jgi:hypothetical protein
MEPTREQSEILQQLLEAFSEVPHPADEAIVGHRCEECEQLRATFAWKHWADYLHRPYDLLGYFPPREPATVVGRDFVPLLTIDALRFFLPVLVSAVLLDPHEADIMMDSVFELFVPGPPPSLASVDRHRWEWKFRRCHEFLASLSPAQRHAVALAFETFPTDRAARAALENLRAGAILAGQ